jgi:hypothetical protein
MTCFKVGVAPLGITSELNRQPLRIRLTQTLRIAALLNLRVISAIRVRLENQKCAFLRSMMPSIATMIMACETSMRCS